MGAMVAEIIDFGWYLLVPAVLVVAGLLLAWWGVWGSRSKGRARCPECWADLSAVLPKLECPTCGHNAGEERRLYHNRRRWKAVVLGAILIAPWFYPPGVIRTWDREQGAIKELKSLGHIGPNGIGHGDVRAHWLGARLPRRLARYYERVKSLSFVPAANDADLARCRALQALENLGLSQSKVTDRGLADVARLMHMRWLDLRGTQISDAGLAHLAGLTELRALQLDGTQVTDAGLVHLRGLAQLEGLDLRGTTVTGTGFAELKQLAHLEAVRLTGAPVTDATLEHLGRLPALTVLDLTGTQITDAGLAHLKGLTKLQALHVKQTQVTFTGSRSVMKAVPGLKVDW